MEGLLEKLQLAQARLLRDVLAAHENDRSAAQLQELKETLEELELVAQAAARPTNGSSDDGANAQPSSVLTPTFYATYLLVLLLAENLNDARFLWKRIAPAVKQESETLRKAWDIGKALWQRDFSAAYVAMDQSWPQELQSLVSLLRLSTRESTAELLSSAYSTISIQDASHALGFAQQEALVEYCATMQWEVDATQQLVRPKARAHAHFKNPGLEQLETLSQYVLHLEQSTVVRLP